MIRKKVKKFLIRLFGDGSGERLIDILGDIDTFLRCWFSPAYWRSLNNLRALKNKHRGERCFIIGNGPSLNKMDLSCLKDEFTFGLNRIYLLFDKLGFGTTYMVTVNPYVAEQCADEIKALNCTKFISMKAKRFFSTTFGTIFIRSRSGPKFCCDLSTEGVWEGGTVTYVAMQIAYYMGFSEVILIGVDHNFKTMGEPGQLITSNGDDPNHFDPNYFGKGFKWQLPNLVRSEVAYRMAKDVYLKAGRQILDATVGGKLNIFPKINYEDIINAKRAR